MDLSGQALGRLDELREPRFLDVASRDLSAGLGEPASEVRAHAWARTGDDDLELGELHASGYITCPQMFGAGATGAAVSVGAVGVCVAVLAVGAKCARPAAIDVALAAVPR